MTTVSDATQTPTTASPNKTAAKSLNETYTTFLNLLTSQIKNQDPLSPMDTTQWTNQLVQYNSVEQQLKSNTLLQSLLDRSNASNLSSGVGYIGKTITANSNTSALTNGTAAWNYDLNAKASTVALTLKDSNGRVVYSQAGETGQGSHRFNWDGSQISGAKLTSGEYSLSVQALDAKGVAIGSNVSITGKVTAIVNEAGSVELKIGNTRVPLDKVSSVEASTI